MTTEIKAGDKVRILLVASKHSDMERMRRGIDRDKFEGIAACDLVVGNWFVLECQSGNFRTSSVTYIGKGMFTTKNSTYSVEKIGGNMNVSHQIVLISGKQGSGKTTLSRAIAETLLRKPKWHTEQLTFAAPLYQMHDYCRNVLRECGITPPHAVKDGVLLQLLGTEWGRNNIDQDVWVKTMQGRIKKKIDFENAHAISQGNHLVFIISDCRFQNEFKAFPEALRVRLDAPKEVRRARAEMWRDNDQHPSEIDLDHFADLGLFDMYINTNDPSTNARGIAELVVAKLEKNAWVERRLMDVVN